MAALPWKDPLAGIIIEEHPIPETSVLSSAISDPDGNGVVAVQSGVSPLS
jgi:hypothetical protein